MHMPTQPVIWVFCLGFHVLDLHVILIVLSIKSITKRCLLFIVMFILFCVTVILVPWTY